MEVEYLVYTPVEAKTRGKVSEGMQYATLPEGATVRMLIKEIGVDEDQLVSVMVNGRAAELSRTLEDGDHVGLFPPVGVMHDRAH